MLTELAIRKAKPTDKPQKLFDGGGLYGDFFPVGDRGDIRALTPAGGVIPGGELDPCLDELH